MGAILGGTIWLTGILFLVALISCSLFAFIETSITAIRLFKIDELERTLGLYHDFFNALRLQRNRVLTTILLANCFANVLATTLSTRFFMLLFCMASESLAIPLSILFTTIVILIFGEVIPKNLAKAFGSSLLHSTLWVTNIAYHLLYPVVTLFAAISDRVIHFVARIRAVNGDDDRVSADEMEFLIKYTSQQGTLPEIQARMLESVFYLAKVAITDIMISRAQLITLSPLDTYERAVQAFMNTSCHYLPVAEHISGELLGYISARDMLAYSQQQTAPLGAYLHHAPVITTQYTAAEAFAFLRNAHMEIAFVQSPEGVVVGLITVQDILALMQAAPIEERGKLSLERRSLRCSWGMSMDELHRIAALPVSEDERHASVVDFLQHRLQKKPERGDIFRYEGYTFVVVAEVSYDLLLILPSVVLPAIQPADVAITLS